MLLRAENADLRLTPRGRGVGLVGEDRWNRFEERRLRYERNLKTVEKAIVEILPGQRVAASNVLRRPGTRLEALVADGHLRLDVEPEGVRLDLSSVETSVKYAGYLKRQELEVERARRDERRQIPCTFTYSDVPGLSREIVQRLSQVRPDTLGQALRVPGVTPAAVAIISAYVSRRVDGVGDGSRATIDA